MYAHEAPGRLVRDLAEAAGERPQDRQPLPYYFKSTIFRTIEKDPASRR